MFNWNKAPCIEGTTQSGWVALPLLTYLRMRALNAVRGFSLQEVLFVAAISVIVMAIAVPSTGIVGHFRLSGDARAVSNTIAVAKM